MNAAESRGADRAQPAAASRSSAGTRAPAGGAGESGADSAGRGRAVRADSRHGGAHLHTEVGVSTLRVLTGRVRRRGRDLWRAAFGPVLEVVGAFAVTVVVLTGLHLAVPDRAWHIAAMVSLLTSSVLVALRVRVRLTRGAVTVLGQREDHDARQAAAQRAAAAGWAVHDVRVDTSQPRAGVGERTNDSALTRALVQASDRLLVVSRGGALDEDTRALIRLAYRVGVKVVESDPPLRPLSVAAAQGSALAVFDEAAGLQLAIQRHPVAAGEHLLDVVRVELARGLLGCALRERTAPAEPWASDPEFLAQPEDPLTRALELLEDFVSPSRVGAVDVADLVRTVRLRLVHARHDRREGREGHDPDGTHRAQELIAKAGATLGRVAEVLRGEPRATESCAPVVDDAQQASDGSHDGDGAHRAGQAGRAGDGRWAE